LVPLVFFYERFLARSHRFLLLLFFLERLLPLSKWLVKYCYHGSFPPEPHSGLSICPPVVPFLLALTSVIGLASLFWDVQTQRGVYGPDCQNQGWAKEPACPLTSGNLGSFWENMRDSARTAFFQAV